MKKKVMRVFIPVFLGAVCICLGIYLSLSFSDYDEIDEKVNYVLCKREQLETDYELLEEYRVYMDDEDYLEKINTTEIYTYRDHTLYEQYRSQFLLDETGKYTEYPDENKFVINNEIIYYHDEDIGPTLYLDYFKSLEEQGFQCDNE